MVRVPDMKDLSSGLWKTRARHPHLWWGRVRAPFIPLNKFLKKTACVMENAAYICRPIKGAFGQRSGSSAG